MIPQDSIEPFRFFPAVHRRRHGPEGYEDYRSYKDFLRDEFSFRFAYCLMRERWYPSGHAAFGVDHYLPQAIYPRHVGEYDNLLYVCNRCNTFKGDEPDVLNPCILSLADHLQFDKDGVAQAFTPEGEIHILLLDINGPEAVTYRRTLLLAIRNAMDSTMPNIERILLGLLGFPTDIPDLRAKRPPKGNTRPEGLEVAYYERRRQHLLPEIY